MINAEMQGDKDDNHLVVTSRGSDSNPDSTQPSDSAGNATSKPDRGSGNHDASNGNGGGHHENIYYDDTDMSLGAKWSRFVINKVQKPVSTVLVNISGTAAKYPKTTVVSVIFFSIAIAIIGVATNFNVDVDEDTLWSPKNSRPMDHRDWVDDESGFTLAPREFMMNVHIDGDNVLAAEGVRRVFKAIDVVRNTPKYDEVCLEGTETEVLPDGTTRKTCPIVAVTTFWNNSASLFEAENLSDEQVLVALSAKEYPDETEVDLESILGANTFDDEGTLATSRIFLIRIELPETDDAEDFEEDALDNIHDLQDAWDDEPNNPYKLEVFAERSFSDEFTRAIMDDIPLVPIVFTIMSVFTCFVFYQRDKVKSRTTLGFGAVMTVFLGIMSGYGLLFTCGVPFTPMTQILPFIMFGIGMDAAYILAGSFQRTAPNKPVEERIEETVRDVGVSIALTTTTSTLAFALGCTSTIPAVYWLCLYAFPTIILDFLYQMTFFIALMVIDEQRIEDNRRDCCVWITVPKDGDGEEAGQDDEEDQGGNASRSEGAQATAEPEESFIDRAMVWYGNKLLQPTVKICVIVAFIVMAGVFSYSASQLTQEFEFTDVVPSDSYVKPFWDAYDDYQTRGGFTIEAYFRDVDQSSEDIRTQMKDFVTDLTTIDEISDGPPFFWVEDFEQYIIDNPNLEGMTFQEQFEIFFAEDNVQKQYSEDIAVDENNHIITSRVTLYMDNIDNEDVEELIDGLLNQRDVCEDQPINKGKDDWPFFTYAAVYLIWEFYSVAVGELIFTTILGVISVAFITLVAIPHWTAALFVAPFITILYIDLMGFLQYVGVHINAVSYIALVMSIGLLVDFLIHILLRYYEVSGDRRTRVIEMLRTMGSSVFLGGLSTFLGVIPLAFSTSDIFSTIFKTFVGLVVLGIGHGLVLMPVILSMCGPEFKSMESSSEGDDASDAKDLSQGSPEPEEEANGEDQSHGEIRFVHATHTK